MFLISTQSYSEIYKASAKKATEYKTLKIRRNEKRSLLSSSEQEHLDNLFSTLFKQIVLEESTDNILLHELLDKGAKTTFFNTNELSSETNFAVALERWLPKISLENHHKHIAEAILICIEAGDAFTTCKYYVGNGGALAIHAVAEHLANKNYAVKLATEVKKHNLDFSLLLFTKMVFCAENEFSFWKEFYYSLQLLLQNLTKETEVKNNAVRFGLAHLIHGKPELIFRYFNSDIFYHHDFQKICEAIFNAHHIRKEFLDAAAKGIGIFRNKQLSQKMDGILFKKWKDLYGMFLHSKESRKTTAYILETSSWFRNQFLNHPESVFKFILEKEILLPLLKTEKNRILSLRNGKGDDLLIALSKANGRTEKMALLFLQYGFSPNTLNYDKETALSIAQKRNKTKLISLFN